MALAVNLAPNGYFAPPAGLPFRLSLLGETLAQGVIPRGVVSVAATIAADSTANAHLALFQMPTTETGADGPLVVQTDLLAFRSTPTTIFVTVPTTVAAAYVVRLWVDGLSGTNGVTVSSLAAQ